MAGGVDKDVSSAQVVDPAGPPLYQVSKTLLHSGRISHAFSGRFRRHAGAEVVLCRPNALQLCSADLETLGPIQPLFVPVRDIAHLSHADCIGLDLIPEADEGCDILIVLTADGQLSFLHYSPKYHRFVNILDRKAEAQEADVKEVPNYIKTSSMSTLPGTPVIVTATGGSLSCFMADFRHLEHRPGNPSYVDYDHLGMLNTTGTTINSICLISAQKGEDLSWDSRIACAEVALRAGHQFSVLLYKCRFMADGSVDREPPSQLVQVDCQEHLYPKILAIPRDANPGSNFLLVTECAFHLVEYERLLKGEQGALEAHKVPYFHDSSYFWHWYKAGSRWRLLFPRRPENVFLGPADYFGLCELEINLQDVDFQVLSHEQLNNSVMLLSGIRILPEAPTSAAVLNSDMLLLNFVGGAAMLVEGPTDCILPTSLQRTESWQPWEQDLWQWLYSRSRPELLAIEATMFRRIRHGQPSMRKLQLFQSKEGPKAISVPRIFSGRSWVAISTAEWQTTLEYEGPPEATAVANLWSVTCISGGRHHALALVSFADASRAIASGRMMKDVSEEVNIADAERTIACGQVAEDVMVQITPHQARCCSLTNLTDRGREHASGEDESASKRASITASFSHLNMRAARQSAGPSQPDLQSNEDGASETVESSTSSQQQEAAQNAWQPGQGKHISCACCVSGMVVVYMRGGQDVGGQLLSLQCVRTLSPAKRKRGSHDEWSLEPGCSHSLDADPSCIDIYTHPDGSYTLAVSAYGPGIHLMTLARSGASLQFTAVGQVTGPALRAMFVSNGLDADQILGRETAEGVHILSCPSAAQKCAGADAGSDQKLQLMVTWRSGYFFRVELSPKCDLKAHSGAFDISLLDICSLGSGPVNSRKLPGQQQRYLVVGNRAAVVDIESRTSKMEIHRLSLPEVRQAVPMYMSEEKGRLRKMLACVTSSEQLQLRTLPRIRPGQVSKPPQLRRLHGKDTAVAALLHKASNTLVIQNWSSLEFIADGGMGKSTHVVAPGHCFLNGLALWTPFWEGKGEPSVAREMDQPDQQPDKDRKSNQQSRGHDQGEDLRQQHQGVDAPMRPIPQQFQAAVHAIHGQVGWVAIPAAGHQAVPPRGAIPGEDLLDEEPQSEDEAEDMEERLQEVGARDEGAGANAGEEESSAGRPQQLQDPYPAQHSPVDSSGYLSDPGDSPLDAGPQVTDFPAEEEYIVIGSQEDLQSEGQLPERPGADPILGNMIIIFRLLQQEDGSWRPHMFLRRAFSRAINGICGSRLGDARSLLAVSTGPYLQLFEIDRAKHCLSLVAHRRVDADYRSLHFNSSGELAVGSYEAGAMLCKPGPKSDASLPGLPGLDILACSQQLHSAPCCLALPAGNAGDRPKEALLQDAGLVMTASGTGKVCTWGWRWQDGASVPRTGALQPMLPGKSNALPTAFPERSTVILPGDLSDLGLGSLQSDSMVEGQVQGAYSISSQDGQVFSIKGTDRASASILLTLQQILAAHPATRSISAIKDRTERSSCLPVEDGRMIIDGDLIGEYSTLPSAVQSQIFEELKATLPIPFKGPALAALLRDGQVPVAM